MGLVGGRVQDKPIRVAKFGVGFGTSMPLFDGLHFVEGSRESKQARAVTKTPNHPSIPTLFRRTANCTGRHDRPTRILGPGAVTGGCGGRPATGPRGRRRLFGPIGN